MNRFFLFLTFLAAYQVMTSETIVVLAENGNPIPAVTAIDSHYLINSVTDMDGRLVSEADTLTLLHTDYMPITITTTNEPDTIRMSLRSDITLPLIIGNADNAEYARVEYAFRNFNSYTNEHAESFGVSQGLKVSYFQIKKDKKLKAKTAHTYCRSDWGVVRLNGEINRVVNEFYHYADNANGTITGINPIIRFPDTFPKYTMQHPGFIQEYGKYAIAAAFSRVGNIFTTTYNPFSDLKKGRIKVPLWILGMTFINDFQLNAITYLPNIPDSLSISNIATESCISFTDYVGKSFRRIYHGRNTKNRQLTQIHVRSITYMRKEQLKELQEADKKINYSPEDITAMLPDNPIANKIVSMTY